MPIPSSRAVALVGALALAGCTSANPEPAPTPPPKHSGSPPAIDAAVTHTADTPPRLPVKPAASVTATLKIDPKPGSKQFQGVWLVRADGSRLLIDYRATAIWKPFAGHQVVATGHVYQPRGQAIMATHYHVDTLKMADPQSTASIVGVGPLVQLSGSFSLKTAPPRSKSAGEKYPVFTAATGTTYLIANPSPTHSGKARVTARPIQRSPFVAHRGGPTLWILSASAQP